jgi:hypothetical protein
MIADFPNSKQLAEIIAGWRGDPERFVREAFPWGEPGPLLNETGPDEWQIEILRIIRDGLSPQQALQIAVASGHGVGKSALVAWIILWGICTEVDTRGVVTANTQTQLVTKTWAELAKWFRLSPILESMFSLTATSLASRERDRTWRIDQIPWSESRTEAFAGLHNQGRRIIVVFDEASAIPDVIFETTEGALTDANTEIIWLVCGNPTRNTGRFREIWGRFANRWIKRQVDSRDVRITNKKQINEWIEDYGEDSDFVRVRVKGEFPRAGTMQFISTEVAVAASQRVIEGSKYDSVVIGVDVARFGGDASIIYLRRGRDARSIPPIKLRGVDTMELAARVADVAGLYECDQIFIDGGGVGGGVIDRLRQLQLPNVVEIQFGSKPIRHQLGQDATTHVYANRRAEMWGHMKEWLLTGSIPNDPELIGELTGVEYGYRLVEGRDAIQLEKKEDMRRRGLASPDIADALALTFALPVSRSLHTLNFRRRENDGRYEYEYDPLSVGTFEPPQDLPRPRY